MDLVKFFQSGGPFMYPILVVLAFGVAISLERYFYLSVINRKIRKLWTQLVPMLKAHDYKRALQFVEKNASPLSSVLSYGFARHAANKRREIVEAAMEEGMLDAMPPLVTRTHYLATFANIATLLGLLGTIVGLIQAFTAVAQANPADKAELLSASISTAMNTTAFGLVVAIPLLLVHSFLVTKTSHVVDSLEKAAMKSLNMMIED